MYIPVGIRDLLGRLSSPYKKLSRHPRYNRPYLEPDMELLPESPMHRAVELPEIYEPPAMHYELPEQLQAVFPDFIGAIHPQLPDSPVAAIEPIPDMNTRLTLEDIVQQESPLIEPVLPFNEPPME